MIDAARTGCLKLEKLEAMTAVCSVGLDMIVCPGDTPAEVIAAIIADEAAIEMCIRDRACPIRSRAPCGENPRRRPPWPEPFATVPC